MRYGRKTRKFGNLLQKKVISMQTPNAHHPSPLGCFGAQETLPYGKTVFRSETDELTNVLQFGAPHASSEGAPAYWHLTTGVAVCVRVFAVTSVYDR